MTEFYCRRNGFVLYADGEASRDAMAKIPEGVPVRVKATAKRSLKNHRHMFMLMGKAHSALPEHLRMSFETFRKALLIDAGYYELAVFPNGETRKIPMSLSFDSMDEAEFKACKDDIIQCLVTRWIPGLNNELFENEVLGALATG